MAQVICNCRFADLETSLHALGSLVAVVDLVFSIISVSCFSALHNGYGVVLVYSAS